MGIAAVRCWILLSAVLVSGGWLLSVLHALNRPGYLGLALVSAPLFWFTLRDGGCRCFRIRWRRYRRPGPFLFLAMALLALAGGLFVPSANWDSLVYRIPRVLHWLSAGRWHWIHAFDPRLNVANTGYEWLAAPLLLCTNSDRLFFLPNWLSFLLLPSLFFSVLRQLGVGGRVASWWMWLLPSGWCFALQAGSTVNDAFATIYALAAIDLALRAVRKDRPRDYLLALLAAALLTGAKQTVMPLVLAVAPALWMGRRLLRRSPFLTAGTALLVLASSGLPTLVLNLGETGSWSGLPASVLHDPIYLRWVNMPAPMTQPVWGLVGNLFAVPLQNLTPPYFPWAERWNAAMQQFVGTPFGQHFREFEGLGHLFPRASEHTAGLGLLFGILVVWCVVALLFPAAGPAQRTREAGLRAWVFLGAMVAALVFCAKVGTWANARQLAAYYPLLLLPLLAAPGQRALVRRPIWPYLALIVMGSAVFWLGRTVRAAPLLAGSAPAWHRSLSKSLLPRNGSRIAYATTWGQYEIGLLLPIGETRIHRVGPRETAAEVRALGLRYLVVDSSALARAAASIEVFAREWGGEIIATENCAMVSGAPEPVYLLDLGST